MHKKIAILAVASAISAFAQPACAEQAKKIPRIGFLASGSPVSDAAWIRGFRQGLRERGYVEGRSIEIEFRYGKGRTKQYPALVTELIRRKARVIVVGGATATRAAKKVTTRVPLVMANVTDPVALGFVASLPRPGGNITGVTNLAPQLGKKRLELLKEVVPRLARVAVLGDPSSPSHAPGWRETESAARLLGVHVRSIGVQAPNPDFAGAFSAIAGYRANALMTLSQPFIRVNLKRIVAFASTQRIPAIFHTQSFVKAGGLMSYAADTIDLYRRAATHVDKILKGAKPADLPVEQPTKFNLVVNLTAARALGVTFPPSILLRATEVIE